MKTINSKKNKAPKIGVNVLIFSKNQILLGLRNRSGKIKKWCPPGGHLNWKEGIIKCGIREVKEETGYNIKNIKLGPYTNDRRCADNKHYVSVFLIAELKSGKLINGEPYDIKEWKWFDCDALPKQLFCNIRNLFRNYTIEELKTFMSIKMIDD